MGVNEYNKVSPEVQEIIKKAEARHPANLQLQHLQEIQSILELAFKTIRNNESKEERSTEQFQKVAEEIRDYVKSIEAKEAPETPDTSKPLLEGLKALEKALTTSIKGINVKPEVNVAAPNVTVDAPKVETKGIEKAVKELGKEFDIAVKSIPKVELPKNKDYTKLYEDMLEKLENIDTGVRLKPQAPETVKVTNPDGTDIGGDGHTVLAGSDANLKDDTFYGEGVTTGIASVALRTWNGTDYDRWDGSIKGSLVTEAHDEIALTYVTVGNGIGEIATAVYKLNTVTVATLTLSYDANDKLSGVVRT